MPMKTLLPLSAFAIILTAVFLSGSDRPALLDRPQIIHMAATPLYDTTGKMVSLNVTAKFRVLELQPDGVTQEPRVMSVETDLVRQEHQTIIAGDHVIPFSEIKSDFIALADHMWRLHHPEPLPQLRRALRERK